ncbi:MAG TPA: SgcJ/EcaC family oxidoreductase [Candidatus Udaeobacter sp.]|nr:SgcJ/EcaC family oxidoreductase [Candidatus Udaeobacter sp.]
MKNPIFLLTFLSALGSAVVAGILFAFSIFVMKALARLSPAQAIAAMQSINVAVINRWFFTAFLGTAICCLVLAVASFFRWEKPGAVYLLIGGLLYLAGTILVTMVFNVPLNNGLAAVEPTSSTDAGQIWTNYVKNWTAWNHVRTAAALGAAVSFSIALWHGGSATGISGYKSQPSSLTTATMLPAKPEDWPRIFERHFNAGDLDAVTALYEADARFVARSGEILIGRDTIRKVLAAMIEAKTQFQSRVVRAVTVGEIAQLNTDFDGTRIDESGNTVPIPNKAIELLRRKSDGTWKLIVGDPNGRE